MVVQDGAIRALCGRPLSSAVRPSETIPSGRHLCLECREAGRDPASVPKKPRREPPSLRAALYPWQQSALDAWRGHGNRGVIEAVTGSGKTRIALVAIDEHVRGGGTAAVLVPTIELLRQWRQQLAKYLPDIQAGLLATEVMRASKRMRWSSPLLRAPRGPNSFLPAELLAVCWLRTNATGTAPPHGRRRSATASLSALG